MLEILDGEPIQYFFVDRNEINEVAIGMKP